RCGSPASARSRPTPRSEVPFEGIAAMRLLVFFVLASEDVGDHLVTLGEIAGLDLGPGAVARNQVDRPGDQAATPRDPYRPAITGAVLVGAAGGSDELRRGPKAERRVRHSESLGLLVVDHGDVRGHSRLELEPGVVDVDHRVIGDDVLVHLRGVSDLADRS